MFHGFYFTASVAVGVGPPLGFEGFVICPSGSIKDLKGSFSSFGGDQLDLHVLNFLSVTTSRN
jgi:hypothetical protein